ncbi:MAG: lactoylglutathione lyase family protein [Alphaproteobacteria bacterium]|nr:lactoylglutathione lyase family protein [Alphaproteobacteria bacterium]
MADTFIWYELMTPDPDAAIDFYKKVVGWNAAGFPNATPDGSAYTVLSAGERGVGGILKLTQVMGEAGMKPIWVGYVGVPDADEAARRIAAAGGAIRMEPTDIPGVGRFAMAADPGGALFYVMTPKPREDEPPLAEGGEIGTIGWRELYSSAGEKASFAFYSGLFGWETMHEMPMGEMGTYRLFGADGVQMGGMMDKPPNIPASIWSFYVNVDGVDAAAERVKAQGGQVLMGPMEVPGGSWIVQCMDPQGAAFALVSAKR